MSSQILTVDPTLSGPLINGKVICITGGTGSFGNALLEVLLTQFSPKKVIVFSRDELKQSVMQEKFKAHLSTIRFFIGDIRDYERLLDAFRGVDVLIHAAALKQVPALEYNPFEAVKTNILGAQNVMRAASTCGIPRVVALSTDKAASPINLYGATKLCQDKLVIAANYSYPHLKTCVVRYGNVFGSRGSVVPFFLKQKEQGFITVTDERMTRFTITLPEGVAFVLNCLVHMVGGEIFIPKLPSYKIMTLAKACAPEAKIEVTGIRPGEKLHEEMVPMDEGGNTTQFNDHFVIGPSASWFEETGRKALLEERGGKSVPYGFCYSSGNNTEWVEEKYFERYIPSLAEGPAIPVQGA